MNFYIYRPDLWSRIRQNAARAGHPIVIFNEWRPVVPGVTDFTQAANIIGNSIRDELFPFADDIPGFYERRFAQGGGFNIKIQLLDDSLVEASTAGGIDPPAVLHGYTINRMAYQMQPPAGESQVHMSVEGISMARVKSVAVERLDDIGPPEPKRWSYGVTDGATPLIMEGGSSVLHLYLTGLNGYSSSVMLSSHDNGWAGFPLDRNPRVAEGSRALFGYSFLFTPMIPIFMAGEEFDAQYHAAPTLSPELYGGIEPGKGRWLYGSQIEWSEIDQFRHRAMLDDVRRMLTIRRQAWDVLAPEVRGDVRPLLIAVPHQSDIRVPSPYMRWKGQTAIVVAANRNPDRDAKVTLHVPVNKLGGDRNAKFQVTDLWKNQELGVFSASQLEDLKLTIKRDKSERGGLTLLRINVLESPGTRAHLSTNRRQGGVK